MSRRKMLSRCEFVIVSLHANLSVNDYGEDNGGRVKANFS